ncbi:MAG TPA: type II toxin-antitoxin system RelE/ParE family toxin [Candidatus Thermoplasmatota archaeon]|nr:type II toxin-antitoxin system RelE/ParE family toxin [Candidatus Thermoplasmatota archaeon]
MRRYVVGATASARKELDALPLPERRRLLQALEALAEDPFRRRPGADVRRLAARDELWRIRVGAYRAIYTVVGERVLVTKIGPRSTVYGR